MVILSSKIRSPVKFALQVEGAPGNDVITYPKIIVEQIPVKLGVLHDPLADASTRVGSILDIMVPMTPLMTRTSISVLGIDSTFSLPIVLSAANYTATRVW